MEDDSRSPAQDIFNARGGTCNARLDTRHGCDKLQIAADQACESPAARSSVGIVEVSIEDRLLLGSLLLTVSAPDPSGSNKFTKGRAIADDLVSG